MMSYEVKKRKMKLKNYTGHTISFVERPTHDGTRYKAEHADIILPSEGRLEARFTSTNDRTQPLILSDKVIQAFKPTKAKSVDDLPPHTYDTYFIVSVSYFKACKELGKDISHLVTCAETVYNKNNKPIGCIGVIRYD